MSKLAPGMEDTMKDILIESIPIGRMGEKVDIALACVYLSTSAASFITGMIHSYNSYRI